MAAWLAATLAAGQNAGPANSGYRTSESRAALAAALDSPDRDARQRPAELVKALDIRPGATVVDLGTGAGYMLPYLSRAVGAHGVVIAEDVRQDFLDRARAKAGQLHLGNVRFVLGTGSNPGLPAGAADLILVLDAYHHFDHPDLMLKEIGSALGPTGRLAIVEFYKRRGAMGPASPDLPLTHIRLDADDLIREVEANGFRLLSRRDQIPGSQYIAIFGKK
jgi:ubiquinone/menaquinone biosynthesis C-methylase UbiE